MKAYLNAMSDLSDMNFVNRLENGDIIRIEYRENMGYFAEFRKMHGGGTYYLRSDASIELIRWINTNGFNPDPSLWFNEQKALFKLTWG